jgi:hypothetical protein
VSGPQHYRVVPRAFEVIAARDRLC